MPGKSTKMPFGSSKSIAPNSSPSSQPVGACKDLPKYSSMGVPMPNEIWSMPPDSVWINSPFVNLTCYELERLVPKNRPFEREKLCNFLSQGIYSGPCALEACCFCGGGNRTSTFQPRCENLEWNNMKAVGAELNCEFIDALPKRSQDIWCNDFGDSTFDIDRLTVKEAVSFEKYLE